MLAIPQSARPNPEQAMKTTLRFVVALVAGCVTAVAIAVGATLVTRILWPEYAAAEPMKAYSLSMLFARLAVGVLSTAGELASQR